MINMFLFLCIVFLFTFLVGRIIERLRVPWVFASLIFGAMLAIYNPFASITSSSLFTFLARLGMYFLLFMIGLELDLNQLKKKGRFIFKATFSIIFLEVIIGGSFIHFVFSYSWIVSFLVALSFATVGEAVLIPILDEFKIINTNLGQTIIGIGTLDDIVEVFTLIVAVVLIGSSVRTTFHIGLILVSLFVLFILTIGFTKLKKEGKKFNFLNIETLFLFTIFVFFLFLGIGQLAETTALAALLAGIGIKTFAPERRLKLIESEIKTMCYGFFAPIFFLWVGVTLDIGYIITYPLLVLLIVIISSGAKLLGSYIIARRELGLRQSILLGIGLSVRFSTSIIVLKILFDNALINVSLYSIIIASSMVFQFLIPLLFSNILARWKVR
ncbi:MAG: hypothetical protein DRP03_00520 [Candidatus Aenigmatarchaeota archaeon]|nr:MAG: hypothetical protein DRP03_00520 [Candidatus Aenigmarchaeota archaeon]